MDQLHLTQPDRELGEKITATPDGMAFWAGSGPAGKTCRQCSHWDGGDRNQDSGELNDARCNQYARMMRAALLIENVPHYDIPRQTAACKYFQENPRPPIDVEVTDFNGGWRYLVQKGEYSKPYKTALAAALAGAKALTDVQGG